MSINNEPKDFASLINNLSDILLNEGSRIGPDHEVLDNSVSENLTSFEQIVEKTAQLFFDFLRTNSLSEKINEYVPGRIFVRLERIAILRYGLSLDQAHKIMHPFIIKTVTELYTSLPSHTIVTNQSEDSKINGWFAVEKKVALQDENTFPYLPPQIVLLKPILRINNDHPPFYFEKQQKVMSCQLHAFNAVAGDHCVDLNDDLLQALNIERNGIEIDLINKASKTHATVPVPIDDFLNLERFRECRSFMTSNGVHAFAYRKDSNGQWWKIDSLYNVGNWNYQVPVELKEERSLWVSDIYITVDHPTKLQEHMLYELEKVSLELGYIEKLISSPNYLTGELRTKISNFIFNINKCSFRKLNKFSLGPTLKIDDLISLQSENDEDSKPVRELRQIILSIRQNKYDSEKSEKIILEFRHLINNVLNALVKTN